LQPAAPVLPYVAASAPPDGSGTLQPLSAFKTNPAGAAIVTAVGPIRQLVKDEGDTQKRYLVIAPSALNDSSAIRCVRSYGTQYHRLY